MISHEINYWVKPNKKEKKPRFVGGSKEHKEFILAKSVKLVEKNKDYYLGSDWYVPQFQENGTLINIEDSIDRVEWEHLKVLFLEFYFSSDNSFVLLHPSDLLRKK